MRTENDCIRSLRTLRDQMARIVAFAHPTQNQLDEFSRLQSEFDAVDSQRMEIVNDGVRSRMRSGLRDGTIASERGAPVDDGDPHASGRFRSEGLRAVDGAHHVNDATRQTAANLIDRATVPGERDRLSRIVSSTIDADYERAVGKLFSDPTNGHREFTDAELRAYQHVQSEARAMNLTDASGGFLLPWQIDPAVNIISASSLSPMRRIARTVTTTTNAWHGITSQGVVSSWDAEAQEVSDDSPLLARPAIPVFKAAAYIQASIEVNMDTALQGQVGHLFTDSKDILENAAFFRGTGVGQPTGLITALIAAGGSSILTSASATLTVADVIANQQALPARWRPRAQWAMNLSMINAGRTLQLGTGLTEPLIDDDGDPMMRTDGGPADHMRPSMLGWPVNEASVMDGVIRAGTTNDYMILSGSFDEYCIVDRIGVQVAFIPYVLGAANRPTGQIGWYMYYRTGGDCLAPDAFRLTNYSG